MSVNETFLNTREAAGYLGQTYRWMQRHYPELIRHGVQIYRIPKDSPKGHIMFHKESLDDYLRACQITNESQ